MRSFAMRCVCGVTCVAVLAGAALGQHGRGSSHAPAGGSHGGSAAQRAYRPAQPAYRPATKPSHRPAVSPGTRGHIQKIRRAGTTVPYTPEESGPEEVGPAGTSTTYGVRITQLFEGTAAKEGLRQGDVILSFNGTATPTFDALRDAVQQGGSEAEVIFLNADNGHRESITLYPEDGFIGVLGESVSVE
jgi:hypothetical protein